MTVKNTVRPSIQKMSGYTPGEQPKTTQRIIKLNTNENPYPPPQGVLDAIRDAVGERLRLYPEPTSKPVREAAAKAYGLHPDQILVGNGSDDLLTMILRTFVDAGQVVASADPTYSLYQTLTTIQGGVFRSIPWDAEGALPVQALIETGARVIFVVRPNSPTGHAVPLESIADLCVRAPGVVVLDEAYADFCDDNGIPLLARFKNLIITRTFSKSFSLAGLRIGFGFTHPELAEEMHKVRDSYNVDALAQAGAVAALNNLKAFDANLEAIKQQRTRLSTELEKRHFKVAPSQANFILARIPANTMGGDQWLAELKARGILIRYFTKPAELADKLRISVGSAEEVDALLAAIDEIIAAI